MYIFQLLLTFLLSLALIKLIIKKSKKLGLVDIPNSRSNHKKPTPRGAGIGFILSFFISFLVFDVNTFIQYWYVFFSILIVFIIGILDDHRDAPPKTKFYAIAFATVILFINGISIDSIGIYFGYDLSLGYFSLLFSAFAIVGFTNAINLIDGLDGLATSVSICILTVFMYIGYVYNDELIFMLALVIVICLLAFMVFNWNPAKIFMGDSGSLPIGFIISLIAVLSLKYIQPVTVLYIVALPVVDTIVVMIRRIKKGRSPFSADKTHIHHILYEFFGGSVKKTVIFLSMVQLMFGFFGYVSARHIEHYVNGTLSSFLLIGFMIIVALSYILFTSMERR